MQFHEIETPGGRHLRVPMYLGVDARKTVKSRGIRYEIFPPQEEGDEPEVKPVMDPELMSLELMHQIIGHKDSTFTDADGAELRRSRPALQDPELANDLLWASMKFIELYAEQLNPQAVSADPNASKTGRAEKGK